MLLRNRSALFTKNLWDVWLSYTADSVGAVVMGCHVVKDIYS